MARDLRSSNVGELEVRPSASGAELIPCELNGRDVYLTAAQIAALGGGGGLPPQWDQDDGTGEVVARTNDASKTPITIEAIAAQVAALLTTKDENGQTLTTLMPNGDLVARPSLDGDGFGGVNVSAFDPNVDSQFASFDAQTLAGFRRGGLGLYARTDDVLHDAQIFADASMDNDGVARVAEIAGNSRDGVGLTDVLGEWRFRHDEDKTQVKVTPNAGQVDPALLVLSDRDTGDASFAAFENSIQFFAVAVAGEISGTAQKAYINPASITPAQIGQILIDYGLMAAS